MKIIIPMAGLGTRFQKFAEKTPEYQKPKPFIDVLGKPMIYWALVSLPFIKLPERKVNTNFKVLPKDLIFIILKKHNDEYFLEKKLKEIFSPEIKVTILSKPTRGAAESALHAEELISNNLEELIVSDSDHYFDGKYLYKSILIKGKNVDGIIPVFRPPDQDTKWSYSFFGGNKVITAVGEKDIMLARKGAYANIGAYYFSTCKLFFEEAGRMIRENDLTGEESKKEFYVAPVYNRLIKSGKKIVASVCPRVWGLGTPKDLDYFIVNKNLIFPSGSNKNDSS